MAVIATDSGNLTGINLLMTTPQRQPARNGTVESPLSDLTTPERTTMERLRSVDTMPARLEEATFTDKLSVLADLYAICIRGIEIDVACISHCEQILFFKERTT